MSGVERSRPRGAEGRLLRGYAPLIAMVAAFTLMVTLVPTVAREQTEIHEGAPASGRLGTTGEGGSAPAPGLPGDFSWPGTPEGYEIEIVMRRAGFWEQSRAGISSTKPAP
jgi:hypothetical protein